jgi:hypothetical protein
MKKSLVNYAVQQLLLNLLKNKFNTLYLVMRFFYKSRVKIVKSESIRKLSNTNSRLENDLKYLNFFSQEFTYNQFLNLKNDSYSSKFEDLITAHILNFQKNGFFVEIGAGDGVAGSNTLLFEKFFEWTGLLVEPAKSFHSRLFTNRPQSLISTNPIFKKSGDDVNFQETTIPTLSTFIEFLDKDKNAKNRKIKTSYKLKTLSLDDLFLFFDVPKIIDFLSIDTEGSEFLILQSFNFNNYKIRVICVEHNYTENRDKIFNLLISNEFERKYAQVSGINDFYVNKNL